MLSHKAVSFSSWNLCKSDYSGWSQTKINGWPNFFGNCKFTYNENTEQPFCIISVHMWFWYVNPLISKHLLYVTLCCLRLLYTRKLHCRKLADGLFILHSENELKIILKSSQTKHRFSCRRSQNSIYCEKAAYRVYFWTKVRKSYLLLDFGLVIK